MKKLHIVFFLLFFFITQKPIYGMEQAKKDLQAIVAQTLQLPNDPSYYQQRYLNCIRILLDPAYMDLPTTDRKQIDTIEDQFKNLHVLIGKTFIPVFPEENIEQLKQVIAEAINTIHSTKINKTGGVVFKKHVQTVIKTLMTINAPQTATENQIKLQWIKPFYINNQFLTADLKKKLFDIFNNANYQKWLTTTKKMVLQTTSTPDASIVKLPQVKFDKPILPQPSEQPAKQSITTEKTSETLTLSGEAQQRLNAAQQRKLPQTPKTQPVTPQSPQIAPETTPQPTPATPETSSATPTTTPSQTPPVTTQTPAIEPSKAQQTSSTVANQASSANLSSIAKELISQALVAPLATIQATIAKIKPNEKFSVVKTVDEAQYTPVHAAASLARADVLPALLKDLTPEQKFEIVMMREKDGQTPLHLAASAKSAPTKGFKPAVAVEELLKGLTPQQKNDLIGIKDNDGSTAADIAQGINKSVVDILKKNMKS